MGLPSGDSLDDDMDGSMDNEYQTSLQKITICGRIRPVLDGGKTLKVRWLGLKTWMQPCLGRRTDKTLYLVGLVT